MAARTGIGVGMGVTVTLLGLTSLTLFVLTFVFLSGKQNAELRLQNAKDAYREFVSPTELTSDEMKKIASEAGAVQKGSTALGYLKGQLGEISKRVGGTSADTPKDLLAKIDAAIKTNPSLFAALADRDMKLETTEKALRDATNARVQAESLQKNSASVTKSQKDTFDEKVNAMVSQVGQYTGDVNAFRAAIESFKNDINEQLAKIVRDSQDREAELNNRLAKQGEELAIARGIISKLQSERKVDIVKPTDEYALVDGEVIGIDAIDSNVYINRGRKHKIVLGMNFEIYNDAGTIKPDSRGEYNRGKATVEVLKIDDTTSTCRVVRNPRGNPIVKGDVIANPIYDPNKKYTFLVIGNFDTNRDNYETPEEAAQIKARIEAWSGRTVDTLSGDVDFLVLGARPVLPPAPSVTAGEVQVLEYIRLNRIVQEYDRIFQQAAATSIPVLNQNRLATLTGWN